MKDINNIQSIMYLHSEVMLRVGGEVNKHPGRFVPNS